jgi:hypothetical protein
MRGLNIVDQNKARRSQDLVLGWLFSFKLSAIAADNFVIWHLNSVNMCRYDLRTERKPRQLRLVIVYLPV